MQTAKRRLRTPDKFYSNDPLQDQADMEIYHWGLVLGFIAPGEAVADELLEELRQWRRMAQGGHGGKR